MTEEGRVGDRGGRKGGVWVLVDKGSLNLRLSGVRRVLSQLW